MRLGYSARAAAEDAVMRILKFYPHYVGALLAVDASGKHAGAAAGWTFKYSVRLPPLATQSLHMLNMNYNYNYIL